MKKPDLSYDTRGVISTRDLRPINELLDELMDVPAVYGYKELIDKTLNPNRYCVFVRDTKSKKIVGMGTILHNDSISGNTAIIDDMVVSPSYGGNGIGGNVLSLLLKQADEWQVGSVHLTSGFKRIRARKLYQKHGFLVSGTSMIKRYKR